MDTVTELDHPVAEALLTRLRATETDAASFRAATRQLGLLLVAEALRATPTAPEAVHTPLATTEGARIDAPMVAVPVLRAGLGLLEAVTTLVPEADIGMVGLRRDEEDLIARPYLIQLPPMAGSVALVLEPMLATGGSVCQAVSACAEARSVVIVSVVAAPEGLRRLATEHPGVPAVVAAVDERLDERGFIVPGLGDFGDRLLGTG